jgi:hydrogenase maturation protein HypF
MKHFPMCQDCREEYTNPLNRRFHAQPNACPVCGPHLTLLDADGHTLFEKNQALNKTVRILKEGKIIAMKGIGGFQLLVDAENNDAVLRLRQRKGRRGKPFAMMAPDCDEIEKVIQLSDPETYWLTRPQAPIVLIEKKQKHTPRIAPEVAGQTPTLGFMLPYSPLHQLLMKKFGGFLVATSGNLSEEPICIDENTALDRLGGIADFFLIHNRPIVRPVDDSVLRIVAGKEMMIRRARGFAPFPIDAPGVIPHRLGVGAELKNTIAISRDSAIFVSQHIGDLESLATRDCFEKTIEDLSSMYQFTPETCVSDRHPDYASSRYLHGRPDTIRLQHHYTHILSCMAEHQLDCDVLGVAWDGTGLGTDGTIWGGEFFLCNREAWKRVGSLRPFYLPGGDRAAKEPRRVALSLLYECFEFEQIKAQEFTEEEAALIIDMLSKRINSIQTTSAGRLFDGFTSLLQLCQINHHEGEAPQALELCASHAAHIQPLHFNVTQSNGFHQVDWRPIVRELYQNRDAFQDQIVVDSYAAGLHHAMSEAILHIAEKEKITKVCLSGGCFQNRILCELTIKRLSERGFQVFLNRQIPPNDGGLSAGQLYFKGNCTIPE